MTDEERTPEKLAQEEKEARGWMQYLVPLIGQYDPNLHLSTTGLVTLMWLSNLERYMELHKAGIGMLAIEYANWKVAPLPAALAMLAYCGCRPTDLTGIEATLKKDSQSGTSISQEAVKNKTRVLQILDAEEMNRLLQAHAYIKSPDFEVPNSLKGIISSAE